MLEYAPSPMTEEEGAQQVDDCWNRVGIRGDKSCPQLVEYIHCRNCARYSAAATRLLDRYALHQDDRQAAAQSPQEAAATCSMLIFRLGEEWLALATRTLVEVSPLAAIHSLPHQRSPAVLGVANVRGALVACLSLVELLGLDGAPAAAVQGRALPRMLIIGGPGGQVVAPVDEVDGIHALEQTSLAAAATTSALTAARYTRGVIQWRGRSIRLLDDEQLLLAVTRSLT
ncbi:chemotaxis protein CheW [Pseudomonas sp. 2FE]|uniref:chemotaxis protein CheW n=1 Tax=Pseudomonas sp. 2FE TaxID=2502190 RepID=UPI0010F5B024|nr:chemotaxis protein CheW [Pseudomonas sp. 2FE]